MNELNECWYIGRGAFNISIILLSNANLNMDELLIVFLIGIISFSSYYDALL